MNFKINLTFRQALALSVLLMHAIESGEWIPSYVNTFRQIHKKLSKELSKP